MQVKKVDLRQAANCGELWSFYVRLEGLAKPWAWTMAYKYTITTVVFKSQIQIHETK